MLLSYFWAKSGVRNANLRRRNYWGHRSIMSRRLRHMQPHSGSNQWHRSQPIVGASLAISAQWYFTVRAHKKEQYKSRRGRLDDRALASQLIGRTIESLQGQVFFRYLFHIACIVCRSVSSIRKQIFSRPKFNCLIVQERENLLKLRYMCIDPETNNPEFEITRYVSDLHHSQYSRMPRW